MLKIVIVEIAVAVVVVVVVVAVVVVVVAVLLNRNEVIQRKKSRAITEAVSRWLPTAAAWVPARVWQLGFMVDKVASGQFFSEYFGFPCQNRSFHQLLHHHNHPGQLAESLRRADHPSNEYCRLS
jgi:ABC-type nickel/cobalt efflux system permease component RcnA